MFTKNDIRKLIVPLIIEQFLAVAIGMADTVMVASCGEAAVSGISLVDTINILLINLFSALATGGAIVASQYLGREDHENANQAAKQLIFITFLFAFFLMVVALVFKKPILHLIFGSTEKTVMENCYIYFFWSAISYPFLGLYNAGAALFRSMGNSKVSMVISTIMNLVNIVGNAILIFAFNMGVAGAAIATLFSRILGAVVILGLLKYQDHVIHIDSYLKIKLKASMIKSILKVGVPNGLENSMFQLGKILVQGFVASCGTVAIAANAVANSVAAFAIIPGSAIGLGLITIVGQCIGANRPDEARKYTKQLLKLSYICMFITNVIIFVLLKPIVLVYNLSADTSSLAMTLIAYHCVTSALMWPAAFVLPQGLRAANDVKFTMISSIFSMWTFRIGFCYVIGYLMNIGVLGVWIAMTIDWGFRIIMFVARFKGDKWLNKKLI